ncbi:MAG: HU family DNA-binding protein [Chloroflexi bacterium]|nr:HU family DNA-binding protein [Chloroflexota bacterium]
MNHTERIAHIARKQRTLTRNRVREIVDLYLEALAEDISTGEWIDLPGIGKIQVVREETKGVLRPILQGGQRTLRKPGMRLRTKIRLYEQFKRRCREA